MVRNAKFWDLAEPQLDTYGQPVIHDIVQELACIRPSDESVQQSEEQKMSILATRLEKCDIMDCGSSRSGTSKDSGTADDAFFSG